MIDGSHHPYDENVKLTAEAVKHAHAAGVMVEAELGMLGGIEEDVVGLDAEEYEKNVEKFLTDPVEAADFAKKTVCDSLAVCHRHIARRPLSSSTKPAGVQSHRTDHEDRAGPVPLVMHGSSSVPQEFIDLVNKYRRKKCPTPRACRKTRSPWPFRSTGVCKVNIDTDLRLALTAKIREVFATKPQEFDPAQLSSDRAAKRSSAWSARKTARAK